MASRDGTVRNRRAHPGEEEESLEGLLLALESEGVISAGLSWDGSFGPLQRDLTVCGLVVRAKELSCDEATVIARLGFMLDAYKPEYWYAPALHSFQTCIDQTNWCMPDLTHSWCGRGHWLSHSICFGNKIS